MQKDSFHVTMTEHYTTIAGSHLFYRVAGAGRPLVLLHGYGTSGAIWLRVLPALAKRYQVFLVDLPGFGRSHQTGRWRLREIAPVLVDWLKDLQLPAIALIGHSMGGAIALHLTTLAPELVERLILVNAAGLPLQASLSALAERSVSSMFQSDSGGYPLPLLLDTLQPRPRIWWEGAVEMVKSDFRVEMTTITSPTLIVWGERDLLLPIDLGRALQRALPESSFVSFPASGHRPMLTEPAAFSRVVIDFLGS